MVGVSVSDRLVTFLINSNAESVTPYLYILLSSETDDLFIDIEEVSLLLDMKPIEKNPAWRRHQRAPIYPLQER